MTSSPTLLKILNGYGERGLKSPIRGSEIDSLLKSYSETFDGLLDLIPSSDHHFLMDPGRTKSNLSFNDLKKFIRDDGPFDLRKFGVPFGSRVGLIFPNGAELAVGVIALLCHWCVLPINYVNTPAETAAELRDANVVAVIAHHELPYLQKLTEVTDEKKPALTILSASPDSNSLGLFSITQLSFVKVGVPSFPTTSTPPQLTTKK